MPIDKRRITSRQEWLEWRRQDVTASDVAALFGLSTWKSPLQVWAEKTGRAAEQWDSPLMRRGRWLEPAVLAALAETYPRSRIVRGDSYYRDPDIRLGATPDAFMDEGTLIETKVTARPVFEGWGETAPMAYQLQAATGAMLTSAYKAIIACLVIDTYSATLELFHVERNDAAEERIREGVEQFWQNVELGIVPEADYGIDSALLAQLYKPRAEIEALDLSTDNRLPGLLIERESLKAEIKASEERVEAIKAELVDKLRGAPVAICGDWTIRHKMVSQPEQIRKATTYPMLTVHRRREAAA